MITYLNQKQQTCFLCHQTHPLVIHSFVKRCVKTEDGILKIRVLRIICSNQKQKRKITKIPLQYTLTILPAFLAPYSKIPIDRIKKAIDYYSNTKTNALQAAFKMNCENVKSFWLYFKRTKKNINQWINFLTIKTVSIASMQDVNLKNSINSHQFNSKWSQFKQLVNYYFLVFQKQTFAGHISNQDYFTSIHAFMTQKKMGLGP